MTSRKSPSERMFLLPEVCFIALADDASSGEPIRLQHRSHTRQIVTSFREASLLIRKQDADIRMNYLNGELPQPSVAPCAVAVDRIERLNERLGCNLQFTVPAVPMVAKSLKTVGCIVAEVVELVSFRHARDCDAIFRHRHVSGRSAIETMPVHVSHKGRKDVRILLDLEFDYVLNSLC